MKKIISALLCMVLAFSAVAAGAEYLEEDSGRLSGYMELLERYEAGEFGDELYYFEAWSSVGVHTMSVLIYRDGDTPVVIERNYPNDNRWEITEQSYDEYKTYIIDTNFDAKPQWSPITATDYKYSISGGTLYNYIHFTPDKKAYVRMHVPGALKMWSHIGISVDNYDELVAREERYVDFVELHRWLIDQLHMSDFEPA